MVKAKQAGDGKKPGKSGKKWRVQILGLGREGRILRISITVCIKENDEVSGKRRLQNVERKEISRLVPNPCMKTTDLISLFRKSLQDSLSGKLWKWLLSGVGSLGGLLLMGRNFLGTTVEASVLMGILVLTGIFLFRLLLHCFSNVFVLLHYRYKESMYGDGIILLKDAFAQVHYLRKQGSPNDELFIESMRTVCNKLKDLFDKITKADCSVSIKIPTEGPVSPNTILTNLCRDSTHNTRDNEKYKQARHSVIGNTAYSVILYKVSSAQGGNVYYLNNKVSKTPNYLTTSFCPEGKLYYESELVYPILPVIPARKENDPNKSAIWGFLCIVCSKPGKLDGKYDIAIAEGVSDGIFDLIVKQIKLKSNYITHGRTNNEHGTAI